MYGRTAVDLISVVGSLSDACWFLDFVMLVTNQGRPTTVFCKMSVYLRTAKNFLMTFPFTYNS